jgi:quercetin dioxygenase-like cupin family protein
MPQLIDYTERPQEQIKKSIGGRMKSLATMVALSLGAFGSASAQPAAAQAEVQQVISKDLGDLPGKEGLLLRVTYPPGSADQVHRHDAHGFVYVEEGTVVMQVRGGQPVTLHAGQGFYEGPDDVHVVGRNASKTKPAKLVVFLVKNKGAPVLTLVP